jgi:hypothetical protein
MTKLTDANGFTYFDDADFDKIIYVSSSIGNNSNTGVNPTNSPAGTGPKQTVQAAIDALNSSGSQALKFKCGDVWSNEVFRGTGQSSYNRCSGVSADRPVWFTSYGDTSSSSVRPRFDGDRNLGPQAMIQLGGMQYIAITNLAFKSKSRDPDDASFINGTQPGPTTGIEMQTGTHILIEDCDFAWFVHGANAGGSSVAPYGTDLVLRRNIIRDGWVIVPTAGAQGVYFDSNCTGVVLDGNYFDKIAPNSRVTGSTADFHYHSVYYNYGNDNNAVARYNITTRVPDSQGDIMLRSGGLQERNVAIRTRNGFNGAGYDPSQSFAGGFDVNHISIFRENLHWAPSLFINTNPPDDPDPTCQPSTCPVDSGIAYIYNNISAHREDASTTWLITLSSGGANNNDCQVYGNIFWNSRVEFSDRSYCSTLGATNSLLHDNEVQHFLQPGGTFGSSSQGDLPYSTATPVSRTYPDPDRSIRTYMVNVMGVASATEAVATDNFATLKRQQNRYNYDSRLQALALINYARVGYGLSTLSDGSTVRYVAFSM